ERPSRREMLVRTGAALGVLAGSAAVGRALWDKGGFGVGTAEGARQVRDFRVASARKETQFAELAIARSPLATSSQEPPLAPLQLVRNALDAMGGIGRFVSRGDIVVVKPNIGWDRMPVHAANTNPDVVAAVVQLAYEAGAKRVVVADGSCNDPNR